jgi:anti-sigma factor RsiW
MTACPDKALLLHALADGELDAANAAALEAHLNGCAGCADALARIDEVRMRIFTEASGGEAPPSLRANVEDLLTQATLADARPPMARELARARAPRWFAGGAMTAIAASLALVLAVPQLTSRGTEDELVANHVRSLLSAHLTDVATSNRHVVKPWFNGKVDFAPPVVDLVDRGFPLVGGRLDYLDGRVVPALVFHRGLHSINLFIRPATGFIPSGGFSTTHNGYSLVRWRSAGLEYWAVSDIPPSDLELFRREFAARVDRP